MNQEMKAEIEALRGLNTLALVERYTELWGKPPRIKHGEYVRKRIAWKLMENRYGGLSEVARLRLEELIAEIKIDLGQERSVSGKIMTAAVKKRADGLTPGTTIRRVWRDKAVEVRVVDDGFEYEGTFYKSLTAVAKAVTGTHWNGRLFFGLAGRGLGA